METCSYCSKEPLNRCETCSFSLCSVHIIHHIQSTTSSHKLINYEFKLDQITNQKFRLQALSKIKLLTQAKKNVTVSTKASIKKLEIEYEESIEKLDKELNRLLYLLKKSTFTKAENQEILNIISNKVELNSRKLITTKNYYNSCKAIEQKSYQAEPKPIIITNFEITKKPQINNFEIKAHLDEVFSILLTEDEKFLISGSADVKIKFWDLSKNAEISSLDPCNSGIVSLAYTVGFKYLISGHYNGSVSILSVQEKNVKTFSHCHTAQVWAMALLADNKSIITCSEDTKIILWYFPSMKKIREYENKVCLAAVNCLALSKSNNFFITGADDCELKIWTLNNKAGQNLCQGSLTGSCGIVLCVVISYDEKNAFSGGADNLITVWCISSKTVLFQLYGHTERIRTLFLMTNKNQLVSGAFDNTIKVWSLSEQKLICTLGKHDGVVRAITGKKDGSIIYSCSSDGTLKSWNINN